MTDVIVAPSGMNARGRELALRRFLRNRPAVAGALVLAVFMLVALFSDSIAPESPLAIDLGAARQAPSVRHPLGTDLIGRDVWTRVVHASTVSLSVGIISVGLNVAIGVAIGAASGYYRGFVESFLQRLADVVLAFPLLVVVLVFVSVMGSGVLQIILALGLFGWPQIARLVRGQFLSLRELDYVTAARTIGATAPRVIVRHLLPNTVGVLAVGATFGIARAILTEASLSFLGLGVQPPTPTWGNMLNAAVSLSALESMPWLWLPPGLMIFVTILAFNFLGDGLRDWFDPRSKPV